MKSYVIQLVNAMALTGIVASCFLVMSGRVPEKMTVEQVSGQMCSQQDVIEVRKDALVGGGRADSSGVRDAEGHRHAGSGGRPGGAGKTGRTVNLRASDNWRFVPAEITVGQGETIRFIVTNAGKVRHEMILGSVHALEEHYRQMLTFQPMAHDEPNMVAVEPGGTGEIVWQFTEAGIVNFACLQPGHYAAGMKGAVRVVPRSSPAGKSKAASPFLKFR